MKQQLLILLAVQMEIQFCLVVQYVIVVMSKHMCKCNLNLNCIHNYFNKLSIYSSAEYGAGSSHKSYRDNDFPQYRMGRGRLVDLNTSKTSDIYDFLIGLRQLEDGSICTWFQFEYSRGCCKLENEEDLKSLDEMNPWKSVWNMSTAGHIKSTLNYGWSKKNQGPFGESIHNDSNPVNLILKIQKQDNYFVPIKSVDSVNATTCKKLKF
jgi:hypothetical protein